MLGTSERLQAALADRYTIERELGRGGMAVVYLAEDVKHARHVAVKVLLPELAATLGGERFLQEIRVTAKLTHPHILTLIDSGEADGLLYYVMPYVDGESLRDRLKRETQLPVDDALRIAQQVASALEFAHRHEVIHRDIKPENILLHEGEAMVADFGIALAVKAAGGERLTETGLSIGTPEYMSPEQVAGERTIDARSDIYSMACVLYEMLAGQPPFTGATGQAVLARHVTDAVPPITTVRSDVTQAVAAAISKALGKAPAARFASAKAFSEALFATAVEDEKEKKSIVVLPFENLSPDPDNAFFADGLTEELIADLSKVRALRVISRTSAMQYKGTTKNVPAVARELNVRYVLEGSVRRAGSNLRITAQLIDAKADAHLWAEKYSGTLDDVFDLQERLSREIVAELRVSLTSDEDHRLADRPIADPRAYDAFLLARHDLLTWSKQGIDSAIVLLNNALQTIGNNAVLCAALGYAYEVGYDSGFYHDEETLVRAERYAVKALELDPELPQAHYALGLVQYKRGGMQAFVRFAKRAVEVELIPDALFFLGFCLAEVGKIEEAQEYADEAVARDPLTYLTVFVRGFVETLAGRCEDGVERIRVARERLAPGDPFSGWGLAHALAYAGREKEAHALCQQVAATDSGMWSDHCALLKCALEHDRDGVLQVLAETDVRQVARTDEWYPVILANALTHVGETDEALDWVEQAISWGFTNYQFLSQHNRFLAPLRGNVRFQQLMEVARQKQEAFEI